MRNTVISENTEKYINTIIPVARIVFNLFTFIFLFKYDSIAIKKAP